jgi:hypothetical protein
MVSARLFDDWAKVAAAASFRASTISQACITGNSSVTTRE